MHRCGGHGSVGDNADVAPAFEFAGDTYDFYAGLGRDSLDDEGLPLKSTVRYKLTIKLTGAGGKTRTLKAKLKVR